MIRRANYSDIPAIFSLLTEGYERSRYRDIGAIDAKVAKGLLVNAIQRDGQMGEGGALVRVAEAEGGEVAGVILSLLQRVYLIGDKLQATDLFYYTTERCAVRDRTALFDAMVAWAEANPRVVEIQASASDIVGDWRRVGGLYERKGFDACGGMWRKEIMR